MQESMWCNHLTFVGNHSQIDGPRSFNPQYRIWPKRYPVLYFWKLNYLSLINNFLPKIYSRPRLIPLNCTLLGKSKSFLISGILVVTWWPLMAVKRTLRGVPIFPSPEAMKKLSETRFIQWYLPFTRSSIPAVGILKQKKKPIDRMRKIENLTLFVFDFEGIQ